jgi:TRAP-type C4-dicarboxylate transport system permease small subunit
MFLRFERLVHRLGHWSLIACTVMVIYLMVTQAIEVVFRAFGHPTTWVYDLNLVVIVGVVFLGLAGAERAGDNVAVDFITERLGKRTNRLLKVINSVLALLFLALLIWFGIGVVVESLQQGRSTGGLFRIPAALPQASLPFGATLMALQIITDLYRTIRGMPPAEQVYAEPTGDAYVFVPGPQEPVEVPLKPIEPES